MLRRCVRAADDEQAGAVERQDLRTPAPQQGQEGRAGGLIDGQERGGESRSVIFSPWTVRRGRTAGEFGPGERQVAMEAPAACRIWVR